MKTDGVIVLAEGEHSAFGPSSAERWMNCPGSRGGGQSQYAAEGTVAHWLSEQVRLTGRPASDWKGQVVRSGEYEFKIGKPFIDSVTTFCEDVKRFKGVALVEERVRYDDLVPEGFGTLDDARVEDGLCVITDLKHGKGVVVEAADNSQLKLYALGLFFGLSWMTTFSKFVLRICQPRRQHFVETETTLGRLLEWGYDVVRPAYSRALTSRERHAGPWCKFCGYKNDCSERAKYKMEHENSGAFTRDADEELETFD